MKNTLTDKNGEPVVICATALCPIAFKHTFGADMLKDLTAIRNGEAEATDVFELVSKLAFIMSAQAENEKDFIKVMSLTDSDYYEFLNRFDSGYFMDEKTHLLVFGTWFNNAEVIDKAKNPQSPPSDS